MLSWKYYWLEKYKINLSLTNQMCNVNQYEGRENE